MRKHGAQGILFSKISTAVISLLPLVVWAEATAQVTQASQVAGSASASYSPVASLAQLIVGLVVVVGLIFCASWGMKKLGVKNSSHPELLKIVSTLAVSARERVMLIEAGENWIVIGVAPGRVNTLHVMPKGELTHPNGNASLQPVFAQILEKIKTGAKDARTHDGDKA
jgi:flagellar protein FliO/FliZ